MDKGPGVSHNNAAPVPGHGRNVGLLSSDYTWSDIMPGTLPRIVRALVLCAAAAGCFLPSLRVVAAEPGAGDVPGMLGGGNIRVPPRAEQFETLARIGAGMCRIPIHPNDYFRDGRPSPERIDQAVLMAHRHGITPMLLFEYYTRFHGELGDGARWRDIGRAFAARFRPGSEWLKSEGVEDWGITVYTAINEPMWKDNNPTPIPVDQYVAALEGLARGVHSVDAGLLVGPGGFQEVPLFQNRNPYAKAVAPLLNDGTLQGIDIHRYWDVQWVPMQGTNRFSLQSQFDQVKRDLGITADIAFWCTEFNFKKRLVDEEEAARGLLTAVWDAVGIVGNDGQPVAQFVLPWNIFHLAEKDPPYGMARSDDPWTPTARGEVLVLVCRLSKGLRWVSLDPRGEGLFVLEGEGRRLWVWQNRTGWTRRPGVAIMLAGIPAEAGRLEIYAWDGLRRTVALAGQATMQLDDLPTEQTLMFLATP